MSTARQGFTLFELILVLAVMVVLAAIAVPSLDAMLGTYRVTAAGDSVRGAWALARAHAMNEGRPYRFSVVPHKGNYRLAPDSSEFWSGNGSAPNSTEASAKPFILEEALPKGVRFSDPNGPAKGDTEAGGDSLLPPGNVDPGSFVSAVIFLPDGTARDDRELVFTTRGARSLSLKLRGLTGVVTARWLPE
jgi:prepilin-type N-terminal cleavage/methylation domain-containing protein